MYCKINGRKYVFMRLIPQNMNSDKYFIIKIGLFGLIMNAIMYHSFNSFKIGLGNLLDGNELKTQNGFIIKFNEKIEWKSKKITKRFMEKNDLMILKFEKWRL